MLRFLFYNFIGLFRFLFLLNFFFLNFLCLWLEVFPKHWLQRRFWHQNYPWTLLSSPVFHRYEPIFCAILEKLPVRLNSHRSPGELRITHFFGLFLRIGLSSMLWSLMLSCCDGLKLLFDETMTYINNCLHLFYTDELLVFLHYFAERIFMSTLFFFSYPFILMHFILLLLGGCAMLINSPPFGCLSNHC